METPFDYLETTINGETLSGAYKMGAEAGIKEVVEWVNTNSDVDFNEEQRHMWNDGWQSKLKEWGIE